MLEAGKLDICCLSGVSTSASTSVSVTEVDGRNHGCLLGIIDRHCKLVHKRQKGQAYEDNSYIVARNRKILLYKLFPEAVISVNGRTLSQEEAQEYGQGYELVSNDIISLGYGAFSFALCFP